MLNFLWGARGLDAPDREERGDPAPRGSESLMKSIGLFSKTVLPEGAERKAFGLGEVADAGSITRNGHLMERGGADRIASAGTRQRKCPHAGSTVEAPPAPSAVCEITHTCSEHLIFCLRA
jgi:hypothetical protein